MPCNVEYAYEDARESQRLTRVACDLVKTLRAGGIEKRPLSHETMAWIEEHDDWDRRREAKEKAVAEMAKARAEALAKLSQMDRLALGIK